jgi:hypothetical protein
MDASEMVMVTLVALGLLALPCILAERIAGDVRQRRAGERARRERFAAERARFLASYRAARHAPSAGLWRVTTCGDEAEGA